MLYAPIAASSSGDNQIVAAATGKKIRVVSYVLVASGGVSAKFTDGPAGSNLTGAMLLAASQQVSGAPMPYQFGGQSGHFETSTGNALTLNLTGATAVNGHLAYELVL